MVPEEDRDRILEAPAIMWRSRLDTLGDATWFCRWVLAKGLGVAPEPLVVTVAMASVTAFFTPIGHHGNLLIYGPGGYEFSDFLRVGVPLTLIVGVIVTILAPMIWTV